MSEIKVSLLPLPPVRRITPENIIVFLLLNNTTHRFVNELLNCSKNVSSPEIGLVGLVNVDKNNPAPYIRLFIFNSRLRCSIKHLWRQYFH